MIFRSSSKVSGYPGFPERSGNSVEILRKLTSKEVDEEVGPMFRIKFKDGIETDCFYDELEKE